MVNILICDDDADFREIAQFKIEKCMSDVFSLECSVKCVSSLADVKKAVDSEKTDILFLDVLVNDENAMNWSIDNISSAYTQIIFMTSFPQSAYRLSDSRCCYYMIKAHMDDETIEKAVRKALKNASKKDPNLAVVTMGHKNYTVNYQDIIYIETFNNNITLHFRGRNDIVLYSSLKEYAKTLPPNFLRCHQSYMVNMNHIMGYEPHKFIVDNGSTIPVPPKKYNKIVKEYLNYIRNV